MPGMKLFSMIGLTTNGQFPNNSGRFCFIASDAGGNCIRLEKQFEHDPLKFTVLSYD